MDTGASIGAGVGGSVTIIVMYYIIQLCIKKKIHTHCVSGCCDTTVDIENSTPRIANVTEKT